MFNTKYLFFLFLFLCFVTKAQSTRFFVSAHQDDWQLFMNPNVYHSISEEKDKTVIIHTTAGEAGAGMGNDAYYLAREKGSLAAIRFLSNTFKSGEGLGNEMERNYVFINNHKILRYQYRNTVVYLLRLPDGNGQGTGYELHDFKTIEKLYDQKIEQLTTIDKSTTYSNREDLEKTLIALIRKESLATNIEIHLADTDQNINPNDHADHQTSSRFFQAVAKQLGGIKLFLYTNYASVKQPQNIDGKDFLISAGVWGVTTAHIADNRHYSTWDQVHNAWIGRQYYRTIDLPK